VYGRGVAFKGGGRVVKNVAGYDFCKLLTGSLGTLGVITQLAFKVTPRAEVAAAIVADCRDLSIAESALGRLANLEASPVAIDLLVGSAWAAATRRLPSTENGNRIVVRVEGTGDEVFWLAERVEAELSVAGASESRRLDDEEADLLWERQIAFSDRGAGAGDDNSPFVVQIAVPASAVTSMIARLTAIDANCVIQAHAASGIIVARFAKFTHAELSAALVGKLRPAAVQLGGSLVVVQSKLEGLTSHLVWGGRTDAVVLLERIKQKFDPKNILNPGRYVF
jgi:glycolate oxidase FAD binding subunit